MKFGCRECSKGPCYIEKNYLQSCLDGHGEIEKDISKPDVVDVSKEINTMPLECIPSFWRKMVLNTNEQFLRARIKDEEHYIHECENRICYGKQYHSF